MINNKIAIRPYVLENIVSKIIKDVNEVAKRFNTADHHAHSIKRKMQ